MKSVGKFLGMACTCFALLSCASGPKPDDTSPKQAPDGEKPFVVSEDLYKKTFSEIEALIANLDGIIKEKNFDEWTKYLSPEYIAKTGSPDFLKAASQSPILKNDRITLKSLKDYFLYVVVPSRTQAKLDEISFLDASHVKAITMVEGKPVILYLLVKTGPQWMVGIW
jgi:hypothetical protein